MNKCSCCSETLICQSCAMPLSEEKLCGTEKDGSKNKEYCIYCYRDGTFTEPNLTRELMVEKGAEFLAKEHNIELERAKMMMQEATKGLKRWSK